MAEIVVDLSTLFDGTAKLGEVNNYISTVRKVVGQGNKVSLTGAAPIWMYLKLSHALHGKVTVLTYSSPTTGEIVIFDHNPY